MKVTETMRGGIRSLTLASLTSKLFFLSLSIFLPAGSRRGSMDSMSSNRHPGRPDEVHYEKEKGVRCDPSVVASEVREKKMPLLYCACWNAGADPVPCLAGLGKTPR